MAYPTTPVDKESAITLVNDQATVMYNDEPLPATAVGRHRDGAWYIGLGHAENDADREVVAPAVVVFLPADVVLGVSHGE